MPVIPVAIALGSIAAAGTSIYSAVQSNAANKKAAANAASTTPNASQVVGDPASTQANNATNLGRAALISTSPSGVLGTDLTGRRKLLGNDG